MAELETNELIYLTLAHPTAIWKRDERFAENVENVHGEVRCSL